MTGTRARYAGRVRGARVLVTGGRGFLGSHLLPLLVELGARAHATSRTPPAGDASGVAWHAGVFERHAELEALLAKADPDVVFHFAGSVSGASDAAHVLPTFHSLLESTVNLLELAGRARRPRVVLAGSFLEPRPEDGEPRVGSGYAAAKWAGSAYARMFSDLYGTPVVTSVPFMVYGPGQQDSKLLPYVVRSLLAGKAPEIGSGERRADWVYAPDVAEGLVACGWEPRAAGRKLDLGSGALVSVREVVERVVRLVGAKVEPRFGALAKRPHEPERIADVTSAREILGWTATTALDDGLARTVEWLRARERSA